MKKCGLILSIFFVLSSVVFASSPFDQFNNTLTGVADATAQKYLDSFAQDLGSVLGGGSFHTGQHLGFPGLDIGVHAPARTVNSDDMIAKNADVSAIFFPILQAEIGLPAKFDLLLRYLNYQDANLIGFGARYGLIKSKTPGLPSISFQAIFNHLEVSAGANQLKANTTSLLGSVSLNLPVIDPYLGIGYDMTSLVPGGNIALNGNASAFRTEAGINLSLFPLTYLQLGGALINGDLGYTLGLGVKF